MATPAQHFGMIQVTIRPMQAADLEQVRAIDRLSFPTPWPPEAYAYELHKNPSSLLLVAEADTGLGAPGDNLTRASIQSPLSASTLPASRAHGPATRIVGVIVVWLILDEAHIATLAVHPDYRRQGISRKLLGASLLLSAQQGARTATLEVRSKNETAQDLYDKFHFQIVGRRKRYYQDDQDDALIMTVDMTITQVQGKPYLKWLESF